MSKAAYVLLVAQYHISSMSQTLSAISISDIGREVGISKRLPIIVAASSAVSIPCSSTR